MSNEKMNPEDFIQEYVRKDSRFYRFFRQFCRIMSIPFYRPRYYGTENIPDEGPLIVASNHIHLCDPAFLIASNKRTVRFLAKRELHDSPIGFLFKAGNTIPVDRHGDAHNSIAAAEAALKHGCVIGIFPEGTRNKEMKEPLLPFKYGAVKIAAESGAYIIPVGLKSKGRPFIDRYEIRYGEPYKIEKDADLSAENEKLRQKVAELIS